jgi:hypothetical protein
MSKKSKSKEEAPEDLGKPLGIVEGLGVLLMGIAHLADGQTRTELEAAGSSLLGTAANTQLAKRTKQSRKKKG